MMICSCCGATVPNAPFCCQCGASQKPVTLGELHENWKKIHYRRIGTKGIEGYETAWKALCILKDRPVSSLMLEDYQAVMDGISDYSYSKQKKLRQLISQLCQYAQMRKIDTSNYAPYYAQNIYARKRSQMSPSCACHNRAGRLFWHCNCHLRSLLYLHKIRGALGNDLVSSTTNNMNKKKGIYYVIL